MKLRTEIMAKIEFLIILGDTKSIWTSGTITLASGQVPGEPGNLEAPRSLPEQKGANKCCLYN